MNKQRFKHNQVIYHQGEKRPGVFLIVTGHIKLTVFNASGDEFIKSILPQNEYFGPGLSFENESSCEETAMAKGDTQLICFDDLKMREPIEQYSSIIAEIAVSMANQKRFQEKRLERMHLGDMHCRVAGMIQELAHHYGSSCQHGHAIDFRMTQGELANLVGASRQLVSSILNEFKGLGLISYTRTYICLDDVKGLSQYIKY